MKTLTLTVGLPRSGKSTWARQQGYPIVCPDDIRLAMHGQPYIATMEPYVWAIARTMVEALFYSHDILILDATSITEDYRDRWLSERWTRQYKVFNTPKDVCIQRARETNQEYLIPVIEKMAEQYEPVKNEKVILSNQQNL